MARGGGYCKNYAGEGTDHPGLGRCRLHGGLSQQFEFEEVLRKSGFGPLFDSALSMTDADEELAMSIGTRALVVARLDIIRKMRDPLVTPKEFNDLSMALQRIEASLDRQPNEVKVDEAQEQEALDEEARILNIEARLKKSV
jgi:hypothetical protein